MSNVCAISLNSVEFVRHETLLASCGSMTAFAFRYASGVAALRITNKVGEVVLLPFHGQQIWDATFYGRHLTMRSMFKEPIESQDYLKNYGGFLLHCGATAMGNPGPTDTHQLHGELPNAKYQNAELLVGDDADGIFMELAGVYRHTVAFSHNYDAKPQLRIPENGGVLKLNMSVTNRKGTPMDLMYLAHVNFRPVDGAELIDTASDDPSQVRVRDNFPEFLQPSEVWRDYIKTLQTQPSLHRKMVAGQPVDPELVIGLSFKADDHGWAHSMQLLPDGSADFISHRPEQLPKGVRWITRTQDQDALGLFLPATSEADGYAAEKKKGNVLSVGPGQRFNCSLVFGSLDPDSAAKQKQKCI